VPGKSPKEAAQNFIKFLKETLSCVTNQFLSAYPEGNVYKVYYEPYASLSDRYGNRFAISITQIFRAVPDPKTNGEFKAKTDHYSYRLLRGPEEENEVLAYHWHPQESVVYPHLHVKELPKVHLPTSRVCLEDFVSLLMRDYKIRPRRSHAECKEILERNKGAFEKMATWKIKTP
jgi:hypothetical protein